MQQDFINGMSKRRWVCHIILFIIFALGAYFFFENGLQDNWLHWATWFLACLSLDLFWVCCWTYRFALTAIDVAEYNGKLEGKKESVVDAAKKEAGDKFDKKNPKKNLK